MRDLHDPETRVTNEATGGQKGKKITQLGAIDPLALIELARVAGYGAEKYEAFNYLKGYDWDLSFNAMMRHALLFWSGEDTDPESGFNHMAHAAWMALALVSFSERGIGRDSRFVTVENVTVPVTVNLPTVSKEVRTSTASTTSSRPPDRNVFVCPSCGDPDCCR